MTPEEYLEALDEPRRGDVRALHELIREEAPDLEPRMDGSMVAYGRFRYRYASGREGETSLLAMSSRKHYISLYVQCTDDGEYLAERYVERLPKADIGKSCVRFKRLADVDDGALRELIRRAAEIGPPSPAP